MGTRRRERQTAQAPVSREAYERHNQYDRVSYAEVVKRVPEYTASRWRANADQPRWQQPDNGDL